MVRRLAAAALLVAVAACSFHEKPSASETVGRAGGQVSVDEEGTVRAAALAFAGGTESFRGTIDFSLRRPTRHDRPEEGPRYGGSFDVGLEASLFGILSSDRRFDHWLDLGVAGSLGGGGAAGDDEALGVARGGAWIEVGLGPGATHPVLYFTVERAAFSSPWENETLLSFGIGRRTRRPADPSSWAGIFAFR